jgi:hypothetical protein
MINEASRTSGRRTTWTLHGLDEAVLPCVGYQGRLSLPPKVAWTQGTPRDADEPLINRSLIGVGWSLALP